jgi:hypothetical protein
MGSLKLKWGRIPDGPNCRGVDSEQYKITFFIYFCILNLLKKVKSDDKGFVLKEMQEMKWRDTLQSTASKEIRISKKMERYESAQWGRTTTMRMGMKDMTCSRNYRVNERKFQHGPILRGKCLVFVDKSSWVIIKVVNFILCCEWSTI